MLRSTCAGDFECRNVFTRTPVPQPKPLNRPYKLKWHLFCVTRLGVYTFALMPLDVVEVTLKRSKITRKHPAHHDISEFEHNYPRIPLHQGSWKYENAYLNQCNGSQSLVILDMTAPHFPGTQPWMLEVSGWKHRQKCKHWHSSSQRALHLIHFAKRQTMRKQKQLGEA